MFIVYEGPDQVGKTTTRKMIEKIRQGKDVGIDRFIGSNLVYGSLFNRYSDEEGGELLKADSIFSETLKPILIYLTAPLEIIRERIQKDNHEHIDVDLLRKTIIQFEKYFLSCPYVHKIRIDTSKLKQSEVVNMLIEFIENVENE